MTKFDPEIPSYVNFDDVYRPNSDTFILCDAISMDLEHLKQIKPVFCVEIGSGSGFVSGFLKNLFESVGLSIFLLDIDINSNACKTSKATLEYSKRNDDVVFDVAHGNLLDSFRHGCTTNSVKFRQCSSSNKDESEHLQNPSSCFGVIDLLLFNPPYVPSDNEEISTGDDIKTSYAGGEDGVYQLRQVLLSLDHNLSKTGTFYFVAIQENDPFELLKKTLTVDKRSGRKFKASTVLKRIRGDELLSVIKVSSIIDS